MSYSLKNNTMNNLIPTNNIAELPNWMAANLGLEKLPEQTQKPHPNIKYFVVPGIVKYNPISFKNKLEQIVCKEFHLEVDNFKENNKLRKYEYKTARFLVWHFMKRKFPELTLGYLGGLYDKDHASVLNGNKMVLNGIETDKNFRAMVQRIANEVE